MANLTSARTGADEAVSIGLLDGRFRLERIIGRGGMGTVFSAYDERVHRAVAVKVLRDAPGVDARRFHTEVETLAPLSHPHLVRLLDVGEDEGRPYFVMDLIDGPTLAHRLTDGALPKRQALAVGSDIADALAYVHGVGLVHRDVKPSNILLDQTGNAKLADFGIARLADAAGVTETSPRLGTPAYLAPEQVEGDNVGPGADVYALGLVLIECLSGHRAFLGTPDEVAAARLNHAPEIPAALDERTRATLTAMTERNPRARISASAAAEALGLLATSGEMMAPPVPESVRRRDEATVVIPRVAAPSQIGDTRPLVRVGTGRAHQTSVVDPPFAVLRSTMESVRMAIAAAVRDTFKDTAVEFGALRDEVKIAWTEKIGTRRTKHRTVIEIALAGTFVLLVMALLLGGAFAGAQSQASDTRKVALDHDVTTTTVTVPTVGAEARTIVTALSHGVADGTVAPPVGRELDNQLDALILANPSTGSAQRVQAFDQFVQQFDQAVQGGQITGSSIHVLTIDIDHLATILGTAVPIDTVPPSGPGGPGHGHGPRRGTSSRPGGQ